MEFADFTYKNFLIRKAQPGEEKIIHQLMLELADYENLTFEFKATAESLRRILFEMHCGDALLVYDNEEDAIIGVMLLSYRYSSFAGLPGIFIEDIYLREAYRGRGIGRILMDKLKREAREQGFGRIDWLCLKSNTDSLAFYEACGAHCLDEWVVMRLTKGDF